MGTDAQDFNATLKEKVYQADYFGAFLGKIVKDVLQFAVPNTQTKIIFKALQPSERGPA